MQLASVSKLLTCSARSVTPQIECYLRVRQSGQVFDFVIANFGLGSAYRVSFSLDADEEDFAAHNVIMKQRGTDTPFSVVEPGGQITNMLVLPPSSVAEMTLRLYGALNYSPNSARDLRCALNGA